MQALQNKWKCDISDESLKRKNVKLFKIPITVKEASKYLDIEVKRLLEIHAKVSNPDFEAELLKTTGIGWKQVKNYKNHPNQFQIIKDNAKVIEFVERSRNLDRWFKVKVASLISLVVLIITLPIGGIWFYLANQVPKTYIVKTNITETQTLKFPKTFKVAPLLIHVPNSLIKLQLGPVQNSNINLSDFTCTKLETVNSKNCQITINDKSTIVLLLSNNVIYQIAYTWGSDPNMPDSIIELKEKIENKYKKIESIDKLYKSEKFENEVENIEMITSKLDDGRLFYLAIIDTLKRDPH